MGVRNKYWEHLKALIRSFVADYSKRLNQERLVEQAAQESSVERVIKLRAMHRRSPRIHGLRVSVCPGPGYLRVSPGKVGHSYEAYLRQSHVSVTLLAMVFKKW